MVAYFIIIGQQCEKEAQSDSYNHDKLFIIVSIA